MEIRDKKDLLDLPDCSLALRYRRAGKEENKQNIKAIKCLFFQKSQCKEKSCDSHCTLCCLRPVKNDIKKEKILWNFFKMLRAFLFSQNQFSINRNAEAFLSCFQCWVIKIKKKKKRHNYYDTDIALYVLKNPVVLTETLARVCKSVLMRALPVPMDWPETYIAHEEDEVNTKDSWWVSGQTRI